MRGWVLSVSVCVLKLAASWLEDFHFQGLMRTQLCVFTTSFTTRTPALYLIVLFFAESGCEPLMENAKYCQRSQFKEKQEKV